MVHTDEAFAQDRWSRSNLLFAAKPLPAKLHVRRFSWVWINLVLVNALWHPAVWLISNAYKATQMSHIISALNERVCRCFAAAEVSQHDHSEGLKETQKAIVKTEKELVKILATLVTVGVFGCVIPVLLLLAPAAVWLQLCSLTWCLEHDTRQFAERMAGNVMTQLPHRRFEMLVLVLGWGMGVFVSIDLEFGIGPVIAFPCLCLFQLAILQWRVVGNHWPFGLEHNQQRTTMTLSPDVVIFRTTKWSQVDGNNDGVVNFELNPSSSIGLF